MESQLFILKKIILISFKIKLLIFLLKCYLQVIRPQNWRLSDVCFL
nr:MAG TPA: hypothetical protein [Caudoviricetes sp.]